MARRLLLLTDTIDDDAIGLIDALKPRGYHASPYTYLTDAASDLVRETPVVLLLAQGDRRSLIADGVSNLEQTIPGVRVVNVLLPEGTLQAARGTVVRVSDFSSAEIRKIVTVIESNLPSESMVEREQPSFALVWDPSVMEPTEYAELVSAIGDLARAIGAAGIHRVRGQYFLRSVQIEVEA